MPRWTVAVMLLVGCTANGADEDPPPASPEGISVDATSPGPSSPGRSSTAATPSDGSLVGGATVASTVDPSSPGSSWSVVDVVDGDTLRVVGPGGEQRVRLIGVNAPETGECYHDEATRILEELVGGADVRLPRDESDTDRFDRLLRYVETVDGVDVGGELVRAGAARSQRYEPDVARNARYDELQAEARAAGRGLWAPDACGPSTTGEVRIGIGLRFDAPGDDNLNLNGEWVRFTNQGDAALDVSGWTVADESSSHRYRFESLVLEPGGSVTLFTGCGTDSSTERYWCNEDSAVWNNSGDTVFLRDAGGNTVLVETYRD